MFLYHFRTTHCPRAKLFSLHATLGISQHLGFAKEKVVTLQRHSVLSRKKQRYCSDTRFCQRKIHDAAATLSFAKKKATTLQPPPTPESNQLFVPQGPSKINPKFINISFHFCMWALIDVGSLLVPKLGSFFDMFWSKIALGQLSTSKTSMSTK